MSALLFRRQRLLAQSAHYDLLSQCLRGIERECLRVDCEGLLALTPHPVALGSALTHPQITTDYSESLLEFITPAMPGAVESLACLEQIHRFACSNLEREYLWSLSMPCPLPEEENIPIAFYGTSHTGQLKYLYRKGLALRYGKKMQCIAGIHYNFSMPEALFALLQREEGDTQDLQDYQSACYIALIRNFKRYSWLLMYLFGASPAVESSFLKGSAHALERFDEHTLHLPFATSLRMSDLGYQSRAQSDLNPSYDTLGNYIEMLRRAVSTPHPGYEEMGTHQAGERVQLSTHTLQIENEFYSSIRPKRVTDIGERPLQALLSRGIQYVEVRCLDINPFMPAGMDLVQMRFLDAFLLFCALQDSPRLGRDEQLHADRNFLKVAKEGRRPGLQLLREGQNIELKSWAFDLLESIQPLASLLDRSQAGDLHTEAVQSQRDKVENCTLTPSAQVLEALRKRKSSLARFGLVQSKQHAEYFKGLAGHEQSNLEALSVTSRLHQQALERASIGELDAYVQTYISRISQLHS